ncbi:3-hydroxyacyl-ACP dehydratase FabZ [Acidilutibacter cellobiosedens]|uniref:3-hydroxyacyl-[acyl-carrier-protein] dehydratase FabZ n=1 Tax=Acidilutibacter cellobiosedens TaxID=2507161 RepID=A0A410QEY2_9FIRM|nr:3-hydroxyacyl-ACP dehydratase FabZ [Acidilutibacter cellobiosedens]MBE6083470.1 3-hydroxyacyl-ACP dehydratase FabZ [Tissierellaceae bacterium]QAT62571.1 3-hydroxyacyl-ACP dehydratase FabZ [Acidilutibacter cellobiosedens]
MKNVLNVTEIKNIIPHRYPFLLVDKVEIIEEGVKGIGYKNITINEYFFQGHFPEYPVMPGVLIIEAMAQTGAVVILSQENFKGKTPFLAGLNKVKFRKKVVPGDTLLMTVEISKLRGSIGVGKGKAEVDGQIVCEAEFLFAIG